MSVSVLAAAAFAEIAGCFAAWAVLRLGASPWWLVPGAASLAAFAGLLTLVDSGAAGRSFASYGGIYIVASLLWMRIVEGIVPDRWDLTGGVLSLAGALVIIFAPRGA